MNSSRNGAHPVPAQRSVRLVEIGNEQEGQRIDNFLLATLKGVPRSHVYRLLRRGEVRVNRGRIKPVYRLRKGDVVRIPPVRLAPERAQQPPLSAAMRALLEASVLYEDESLLVLNKPGGLAVHGGSTIRLGLIEALRLWRPDIPRLELVHRLDRETSGCLLLAKDRRTLRALQAQLQQDLQQDLSAGGMEKRYLALLQGAWTSGERLVELPLVKNRLAGGERLVRVSSQGRRAVSRFLPKRLYRTRDGLEASLMEVILHTGRMHQIRVHAAALGHPVAGDAKYGDPDFNRHLKRLGLKRLFLHAARLVFRHPASGDRLAVEAPLDEVLQGVLDVLAC